MSAPRVGLKRWRLRPGSTEAALVTTVRDEIVPHYRALDPRAVLGLLRSDIPGEYVATQTWPSGEYRERVCSGDRYALWFQQYLPILARFDALVQFVDEIDSTEVDGTDIDSSEIDSSEAQGAGATDHWTGVQLLSSGAG